MKENHPEFNEIKFEAFLREAEKNDCPPEAVGTFLTSSFTKSGYLEPEDEGEDEYDDPEPPSSFERVANVAVELGKTFLTGIVMMSAAKKDYNNDPVRTFTSVMSNVD